MRIRQEGLYDPAPAHHAKALAVRADPNGRRRADTPSVVHLKGEHWLLHDGREIIITHDLANNYVRVLNDHGMLEVITESYLKERLPDGVA